MKKQIWALLLVMSVGLLSFGSAQNSQSALFDAKKSQQELQIMKGILSTTLGFVASELRNREAGAEKQEGNLSGKVYLESWGGPGIGAYYLYGQGATFIIPISSLRLSSSRPFRHFARIEGLDQFEVSADTGLEEGLMEANAELEAASLAMEEEKENVAETAAELAEQADQAAQYQVQVATAVSMAAPKVTARGTGQAITPPPPPPPPPPPAVAQMPRPPKPPRSAEEMRKKLAEVQEKVKNRREAMEGRRQKLLQSLSEVKVFLIEALANHGDSLTTIKPGEYINIIFTTDEGPVMFHEEDSGRSMRQVVSIQKSWIIDYKAGRLTMEAFKQKALQYST